MTRVAILGPGLLGGSLAMRLRALGGTHLALWARREDAVAEIRAHGCVNFVSSDLRECVRDAEIVVICTPVAAMAAIAREFGPMLPDGAIVTDIGSVKARVVSELGAIFGRRFVGSHPMAGNQHTGFAAAEASLFDGTTCIVTPGGDADAAARVAGFWKLIGCRVVEMQPEQHDACVALISHLPHIVAGALIHTVAAGDARAFDVVGPGFRDTTRVASGPPEMWAGILRENAAAVVPALDGMIAKLGELRQMLAPFAGEDLRRFLADAKAARDRITFPK
jgi:prephenate dehydrogenase